MYGNFTLPCLMVWFLFSSTEGASLTDRWTLPRYGYKLKYVDHEVTCPSLTACLAIGNRWKEPRTCHTISYKSADGSCIMFQHPIEASSVVPFVLEVDAGWLTMSKVNFGVYLANYPNDQIITLDEGIARCAEYNKTVATRNDLEKAISLGSRHGTCGLIADGSVAAPHSTWSCAPGDQDVHKVWCVQ